MGTLQAFISQFAASIAAETKARGIDVCAVHPSPVASNFYDKTHKLDAIEFFKQ
jgi:short-subunit dehydrogenase